MMNLRLNTNNSNSNGINIPQINDINNAITTNINNGITTKNNGINMTFINVLASFKAYICIWHNIHVYVLINFEKLFHL